MIENATINALTAPAAADKFGDAAAVAPTSVSVRANLQDVTERHRSQLGAQIQEATAVLYVLKARLGNMKPARGYEVRVTADGGSQRVLVVEHVGDWTHGTQSHYVAFLKEKR